MTEPTQSNHLIQAYDRMMERVKIRLEELEQAEKEVLPQLRTSIRPLAKVMDTATIDYKDRRSGSASI